MIYNILQMKKARVMILKEQDNGLNRISTYEDITEIDVQSHHTVLITQESESHPKRIVGIIPDNFVVRANWED